MDDGRGFLWMTSNRGVFRVAREEIVKFAAGQSRRVASESFGAADGMRESECNGGYQPAGWRASDGTLWFPTAGGLVSVDPAHLPSPPRDAAVHLPDWNGDRDVPHAVACRHDAHRRHVRHLTLRSMPIPNGTRFGPYEIAGWLGAGGMGEVYRARDVRLERQVAIKVVPERLVAESAASIDSSRKRVPPVN